MERDQIRRVDIQKNEDSNVDNTMTIKLSNEGKDSKETTVCIKFISAKESMPDFLKSLEGKANGKRDPINQDKKQKHIEMGKYL